MKAWVYKATETKIGYHETRHLAMAHHVLCRAPVDKNGDQAERVGVVDIGDIIHFYYKHKTKDAACYGTFEVIDGSRYPTKFGRRLPGTALFEVLETPENAEMIQRLTEERVKDPNKGYERYACFNGQTPGLEGGSLAECFSGWAIKRLDGHPTPKFDQTKLFPGPLVNLWPYPDAELGKPRTPKPRT